MNCAYFSDVDVSNDNLIPVRLLGEISYFSFDLLNNNDEEIINCVLDNGLIFQLQSANNKQTYFSESLNEKETFLSVIPKKFSPTYDTPLIINILHSYTKKITNDMFTTPSIVFTPMNTVANEIRRVTLCIDSILLVTANNVNLGEISKLFIRSINKQISEFKKSYKFLHTYFGEKKNLRLIALHFRVDTRWLILLVPEQPMDFEYGWRCSISKELKLRKTLQRTESVYPPKDVMAKMTSNGNKLINPHLSIVTVFPECHTVIGRYTYYHYLQDGINDKGWGCAYRSLQTIVSWYVWQGWSTIDIPCHRDIQACLVRMRDKDESFIGSQSWIGSFEINLVLQDMIKVDSRIVSLTRGSDLSSVYDQLADHFSEAGGAPVMIGGGQLAHTIIGVSRDRSQKVRFLVLDPHYTGSSTDLSVILTKGWCAWKELSFWRDNLPYNLCLPPPRPNGASL